MACLSFRGTDGPCSQLASMLVARGWWDMGDVSSCNSREQQCRAALATAKLGSESGHGPNSQVKLVKLHSKP